MGEDHTGEPQANQERLTVAQAAAALGITEGAVRSRIKRGTLPTTKERGTVFVLLGDGTSEANQPTNIGVPGDQSELIGSLQDQIRYLRNQLDAEREAQTEERRRHDTIVAQLTSRIPSIEAPPEAREPSQTAEEAPERTEHRPAAEGVAQEGVERPQQRGAWRAPVDRLPWWQYLLGLGMIAGISAVFALEITYTSIHAVFGNSFAVDLVAVSLFWMIPGIFGFWVGFKRRSFRLWRHLVPIGALVGVTAAVAAAPQTAAEISQGGELTLALTVLIVIPALILFISGATVGRAVQRKTAGAYASLLPDTEATPSATRLIARGDKLSPRMQALLGFSGAVISALISVIGQIILAGMGGGS